MKLSHTREVNREHRDDPKISHCQGFFLFEHIQLVNGTVQLVLYVAPVKWIP